MKAISRRVHRLEDQFAPADRKPRRYERMIVYKWGSSPASLENARCKRPLCPDGTLLELVELEGSNEGLGTLTDDEQDEWVAGFPVATL